jgi:hypothetical protein
MIHTYILKPDTVFQIAEGLWFLGLYTLEIICEYDKVLADPHLFPCEEILQLYKILNGAKLSVWSLKLWKFL